MSQEKPVPTRFIGLDVYKHYLVAIGVDSELNQVLGPRRVPLVHLDSNYLVLGFFNVRDTNARVPTAQGLSYFFVRDIGAIVIGDVAQLNISKNVADTRQSRHGQWAGREGEW